MKVGERVIIADESSDAVYGKNGTISEMLGIVDTASGEGIELVEVETDDSYFDDFEEAHTKTWVGPVWMIKELT